MTNPNPNHTADESPNQLEQEAIDAQKNGGKTLAIVLIIVVCMGALGYYAIFSGGKTAKQPQAPDMETTYAPLTVSGQGRGIAQPPPEAIAAIEAEIPKESGEDGFSITVINDKPPRDFELEEWQRQQAERKKLENQQALAALTSPPLIKRTAASGSGGVGGGSRMENVGGGTNYMSEYDPAEAMDKEAFFERADTIKRDGWVSPYTREAGRQFELKTGAVVPGVMVSGINSDLPGNLIAQVSVNVYDTATGKHLLIPRGSRLFGVYDSRVVYGQERVLIAWNRIVFPDGSSVSLGAMPGADMAGYAGFKDQVNNHYFRIFGTAVLMSLISGATSYAIDQNSDTNAEGTTMQGEMTAATANMMSQTTLSLLQKNLSISPTLEIRPGYEFNIIVTRDVIFNGEYR